MIKANNFTFDKIDNHLIARCDVAGPSLPKCLWFAAESDDESALEIEEPNWAAVALIYPAMGLGQDLVLDAKISPRLLYNLNHDAQHLLQAFNPNLKKIRVIADIGEPKAYEADVIRHSTTGFSGGADSSATYVLYSGNDIPESMRISALSIYDVGALGRTPKTPSFERLRPHYDNLRKFCDDQQVEAFGISSNLRQIFRPVRKLHPTRPVLSATISLRNIAATLAMQSRVKNYYPSGNSGFSDLGVVSVDSIEAFEPVLDLLLSTETLYCQTGAAGLQRFEKLKLLANVKFAQTDLNVCVGSNDQRNGVDFLNCGRCWKCIDTQIESDALGILDNFSAVFDIKKFMENRNELLDFFAEKGAYDELKLKLKLNVFSDLYQSSGRDAPSRLVELTHQIDKEKHSFSPSKSKSNVLARLLAKIR